MDNGATAVYVYDALNRRVRVQTASATDEYVYDYASRRISTWLPNGAGIEGRIYWSNRLVAFRAQNGDTYFDQKDALGTDRLRMNYAATRAKISEQFCQLCAVPMVINTNGLELSIPTPSTDEVNIFVADDPNSG